MSALCLPDSTHVNGSLRYLMRVNARYHNLVPLQFRLLSHFQNEIPSYWVRYNEKYGPLSLSLTHTHTHTHTHLNFNVLTH